MDDLDPSLGEIQLDAELPPPVNPVLPFSWRTQVESQLQDPIMLATMLNSVMRLRTLQMLQAKKVASPPTPLAKPPPSPQSLKSPKKKPDFKSCASRGVRHSYAPYIRPISTPNWTDSPSADRPAESPHESDFTIRDMHRKLEVYESRIISRADHAHRHPALSVVAMDEADGPIVLSGAEADRADRYRAVEVADRIPRFWPARPWDRPEAMMTQEETDRMAHWIEQQVVAARPGMPERMAPRIPRIASDGGVKKQVKKKNSVIVLETELFLTDGSGDETDWEDY
jgi:hypothetical protein